MATVKSNKSITVMKYNDFIDDLINISIRDSNGDEVLLLHKDTVFLYETLKDWIEERGE